MPAVIKIKPCLFFEQVYSPGLIAETFWTGLESVAKKQPFKRPLKKSNKQG
jgi:hypothetical protein